MKETILGNHLRKVPSIAVGCMRLSEKSKDEMNHFIHSALEQGAYFFDHADIYGGGMSETVFGEAFSGDPSLKREDIFLQSKCGIRQGFYDLSKDHILESVDGILKRLQTDYLDLLLLQPEKLLPHKTDHFFRSILLFHLISLLFSQYFYDQFHVLLFSPWL